ncbi:MAG TPA: fused MFS/spermidine synthase [Acidimicrobiia bacterium]|nr:fused MFS/spermidine synthase [Acidimicrobiia bacterium]
MSQTLARTLVFVTAAAVLILEILAGRLLAPYLGVSLEVFTGIIGVILAGISVGAWLGGRAADRGDPVGLLGPLLVAGGLSALAAPLLVDLVGPAADSGPLGIIALTTVGFFLPSALLSAVPPAVVKIRLASLDSTGSVVGSYSAIGTAGAIFGTFVTGFFLIAAFPTRPIVIGVGVGLTLGGLAIWVGRKRSASVGALAATVVLGAALVTIDGPCDYETAYHCAELETDLARPSGRLLILDRGHNSYVDLADPTHLEFRYLQAIVDVIDAEAPAGPLDIVSIGGGGFTLPRYLDATRPGSEQKVLEIDARLVDIGRTDLGFDDQAVVVVDDARRSMEQVELESLDVVVGDAFSGLSVPWHLTTVEFVTEIADRLRPGGIYAVNVIDYADAPFARAAAATLGEVFEHVAVVAPPGYFDDRQGGNYVLVGSDRPFDQAGIGGRIAARAGSEVVVSGAELDQFIGGAPPLVDDFAPVDQMIDWHY